MSHPTPLIFPAGTQRDGTRLDSDRAVDAQWARCRIGRWRKMLGFKQLTDGLKGVPRRIHMFYQGAQVVVHIGTSNGLQQVVIDYNGNVLSMSDRTPATFVAGINVGWTFDAIYDGTSKVVQLVAHAVPDLGYCASVNTATPFIGQITSQTILAPFTEPSDIGGGSYTQPAVAGGVFCVQPYVFDFDQNGFVGWSAPSLPFTLGVTGGSLGAGSARVSAQKLVAGMALRGGGVNSPAGLLWSLSEVIAFSFIGGTAVWAFNTISPSSSILSTDCVIEYDGLYFWIGVDRFLMYNGIVMEVPNQQNLDWFFDNLNREYAASAFAFKVPRFGEIWFCAPLFGSTVPNYAAIFNVRENVWYDTVLPNGGRGCGYFAQGFPYPLMGGVTPDANGYSLWMHEFGYDQLVNGTATAIRSYIETPILSGLRNQPASDQGISLEMLEMDAVQAGDLSVYVVGSQNPRAPDYNGPTVPIPAIVQSKQDQAPGFRDQRRLLRLHIESNVVGGNFILGRPITHLEERDSRILQ